MDIYTGFEIEVEAEHEHEISDLIDSTRYITEFVGNYPRGYHSTRTNSMIGKWRIEYDESLHTGAEFISPIMPMQESLEQLFEFLKHITPCKCFTSHRCGMHMGISATNRTLYDFDFIQFMSRLNQRKLYSLWTDRLKTYNSYCIPLQNTLKNLKIKQSYTQIPTAMRSFAKQLIRNRHNMINFRTFNNNNYLEIRLMGGKDYHKKTEKIIDTTNYFSDLIKETYSTTTTTKDYKKITSYINRVSQKLDNIWIKNTDSKQHIINVLQKLSKLDTYSLQDLKRILKIKFGSGMLLQIKLYLYSICKIVSNELSRNIAPNIELKQALNNAIYYVLKTLDKYMSVSTCSKLLTQIQTGYSYFGWLINQMELGLIRPENESLIKSLWMLKYV